MFAQGSKRSGVLPAGLALAPVFSWRLLLCQAGPSTVSQANPGGRNQHARCAQPHWSPSFTLSGASSRITATRKEFTATRKEFAAFTVRIPRTDFLRRGKGESHSLSSTRVPLWYSFTGTCFIFRWALDGWLACRLLPNIVKVEPPLGAPDLPVFRALSSGTLPNLLLISQAW